MPSVSAHWRRLYVRSLPPPRPYDAPDPVSGFAGVILYFIALFGILGDVLGLLSFRTHFAKRMQKEIPGLIAASISYYVFWWILPRFVLDFYLYLSLYVVAPFVAIIGLMATGTLVHALRLVASAS